MTASSNPDENAYIAKDAASNEPAGFVYDDPGAPAPETESAYIPEREFVLMPLFRRMGELLGIRRRKEPEYIYEAVSEVPPSDARSAHGEASITRDELGPSQAGDLAPVEDLSNPWTEPQTADRLADEVAGAPASLSLEPSASEPEVVAPAFDTSGQMAATEYFEQIPPPVVPSFSAAGGELEVPEYEPEKEEAEPSFEQTLQYGPEAEAQVPHKAPTGDESTVPSPTPSVQPHHKKVAPRRKDEIDEAVAVLREAASRVSLAISEAVEWLSAKEAELVRKAERSLAPPPRTRRVPPSARSAKPQQLVQSSPAVEPRAMASDPADTPVSSAAPKWEPLQFPALQREVAWNEQAGSTEVQPPVSKLQPAGLTPFSVKRRPALVQSGRRVPFWKRIDWAEEFTPKRVAVLGGVMMAMLLVAGVTLARRPASDMLPPQPRPVQPGGVTLSTHPATSATKSPTLGSPGPTSRARQAAAPHRAKRAVAEDDEPDVVTHYYRSKPSPSKQATVAGVKHYSDME